MHFGIVGLLLQYKYFIMVPLVFFLQPVVGVMGGALARTGFMDVFIVYGIVFFTALVGDVIWYWVGYHYGEPFVGRWGRFLGITSRHVKLARDLFQRYHAPILFMSKILNGLGLAIAVLFTAGMSKVPFWRYLFFNAIGEAVWSLIIVSAGYFVSDLFVSIEDTVGRISLGVLVVIGLFFAARGLKLLYKRLEESSVNN